MSNASPCELSSPSTTGQVHDSAVERCSFTLHHLYEFLDGKLSPEQLQAIQSHLEACPECAEVKNFELMIREKMRSSCAQKAPDELKSRLLKDVQQFCALAQRVS